MNAPVQKMQKVEVAIWGAKISTDKASLSGNLSIMDAGKLSIMKREHRIKKLFYPMGGSVAYFPPIKVANRLSPTAALSPSPPQAAPSRLWAMGLAHTRAGPGGAIARSGGKVVVLCYPLLVLPASAVLLDLSISLLGYEALVCWICVSAARVDMFVIVAPDPSCESPS